GTVAASLCWPGAAVAATGTMAVSQPPPATGRRTGNSTCVAAKPWFVSAYTAGGIVIVTACPAQADGNAGSAGVPLAATESIVIPARTATSIVESRERSSEDAARTTTGVVGTRLGAVYLAVAGVRAPRGAVAGCATEPLSDPP